MRYFTDNPLERMMMQIPRPQCEKTPYDLPETHPCHGCKRYGEGCVLPCYRGVTKIPENKASGPLRAACTF